jgi:hypothetical protein
MGHDSLDRDALFALERPHASQLYLGNSAALPQVATESKVYLRDCALLPDHTRRQDDEPDVEAE